MGEFRVDYPEPNIWNEHPLYILDVPWSNSRQCVPPRVNSSSFS